LVADEHDEGAESAPSGGSRLGDAVFAAAVAALFALLVLRVVPELLQGRLVDTDSYMRLVRVRRLAESWAWFDATIPRSNAPFGETLHWTRPLDVLLLLGAGVLRPLLGFPRALHVAGVALSPLLLIAVCFTAAWAVRPLAGARVRYYTMIAVLAQVGAMGYALPGRADHHMLILLAFVAMHGAAIRLLLAPSRSVRGWSTGAWAAFGVWISTEFLVPVAVLILALTGSWILRGGDVSARARSAGAGLVGLTAAAVLLEHPPSALLAPELDRVSIVHLFVFALVALFWVVAASRRASRLGPGGRFLLAGIGGSVASGVVLATYPGFFGGPMANVDPELKRSWLPFLTEFQPFLVPHGVADVGRIIAYLGTALIAAAVAARGLIVDRGSRRFDVWVLLAIGLLAFVPLGIRWVRFVMYAELLGVLGSMELLSRALLAFGTRKPGPRLDVQRAATAAAVITGPLLLGAAVMALGGEAGKAVQAAGATQTQACAVEELVPVLDDPDGLGNRPRTVLAHVDLGPVLLYRTPHSVVATPYHRNARGILDARSIFETADPEVARRLIEKRGVGVVVTCGVEVPSAPPDDGLPFVTRLRSGDAPDWIVPVHPRPDLGIWRVVDR
jgi:hypothetical protein